MTSLNRQRANITFSALLDSDTSLDDALSLTSTSTADPHSKPINGSQLTIFTPADIARHERIFHRGEALQWTTHPSTLTSTSTEYLGSAQIGLSLSSFFGTSANSARSTIPVQQLTALFSDEAYLLFLTPSSSPSSTKRKWHASILLKKGCTTPDQLKAWTHALLAARVLVLMHSSKQTQTEIERGRSKERRRSKRGRKESPDTMDLSSSSDVFTVLDVLERTLSCLNTESRFGDYLARLRDVGWNLDIAALETRGRRRVSI